VGLGLCGSLPGIAWMRSMACARANNATTTPTPKTTVGVLVKNRFRRSGVPDIGHRADCSAQTILTDFVEQPKQKEHQCLQGQEAR